MSIKGHSANDNAVVIQLNFICYYTDMPYLRYAGGYAIRTSLSQLNIIINCVAC